MPDVIIRIAQIPTEFPAIAAIRKTVFQEEQAVDPLLEFDGKDETSDHLIAYLNHQAVGTARIRYLDQQTAKIERLAVLSVARGQGIGRKMMEKALEVVASYNISEVIIHAQVYIKPLYQTLEFIEVGDIFIEAGIPHIEMRKKLK